MFGKQTVQKSDAPLSQQLSAKKTSINFRAIAEEQNQILNGYVFIELEKITKSDITKDVVADELEKITKSDITKVVVADEIEKITKSDIIDIGI